MAREVTTGGAGRMARVNPHGAANTAGQPVTSAATAALGAEECGSAGVCEYGGGGGGGGGDDDVKGSGSAAGESSSESLSSVVVAVKGEPGEWGGPSAAV